MPLLSIVRIVNYGDQMFPGAAYVVVGRFYKRLMYERVGNELEIGECF